MPVITIFSGIYSCGEDVAQAVARTVGYPVKSAELYEAAAQLIHSTGEKVSRSLREASPLLDRFTHEKGRALAALRCTLADLAFQDRVILLGEAGHLIHKSLEHCLRCCCIANLDWRINEAQKKDNLSAREARRAIHKRDEEQSRWTMMLFNKSAWDESLYDLVIPMHATTVGAAAQLIAENAQKPAVQITPASHKAAADFVLASRVWLELANQGHEVEVQGDGDSVTVLLNRYVHRLEPLQEEIKKIGLSVSGVRHVEVRPGPKFTPPSLVRTLEVEVPQRILLVDDEKEFVHTLSERLKTRQLESSVAYDGEQAIEMVQTEEPDVMVLDLKMPGIDGMEVLRRMKRDHPQVEVVILTGHGSDREEALAKELGAFAYLRKPVNVDFLAQTLKQAYQKVLQTRHTPPETQAEQ